MLLRGERERERDPEDCVEGRGRLMRLNSLFIGEEEFCYDELFSTNSFQIVVCFRVTLRYLRRGRKWTGIEQYVTGGTNLN